MKVLLYGLTGLGNIALEELIENKAKIVSVSTRQEKGNYPYFNCKNIEDLCKKHLIPISYNTKKRIPGKGSAIFIHLTKNYKKTDGCIALKKNDFLILIKLLKPKNKIRIN